MFIRFIEMKSRAITKYDHEAGPYAWPFIFWVLRCVLAMISNKRNRDWASVIECEITSVNIASIAICLSFHLIRRTSAMRGKTPPRGFVPSAPCWNPNVLSSLLQNHPKPTPRAATIFRSAGRDLRNKRSPRHAERSACRAITRGSGGEQLTYIYSIPTSAVWGIGPPRDDLPTTALLASSSFIIVGIV